MVQCDSVGRRQLSQGLLKPPAVKPQFITPAMGLYTLEMAQRGTRTKDWRDTQRVRGGFQAQWPPALAGHTSIFFNGREEAL